MALIILLTVSGCGNDADGDSTAGDSRSTAPPNSSGSDERSQDAEASSDVNQSVADPKARKALRSAIVRLLRTNTGHFEVTVPFGSDSSSRERGRYQVRPVAYEA